jgi:hypothetical protein
VYWWSATEDVRGRLARTRDNKGQAVAETRIIGPGEAGYDETRRVRNAMVDRRPAMIVPCREAADGVAAIAPARREGRRPVP